MEVQMVSRVYALMGATIAVVLVIAGLWGWGSAGGLAQEAGRPEAAIWAVRAAAVAALAGAQVLGMTFIVDSIYARDRGGELMRLSAGLVCTAALVGALGLGLMSM
jgi:hypothetical protein